MIRRGRGVERVQPSAAVSCETVDVAFVCDCLIQRSQRNKERGIRMRQRRDEALDLLCTL